LSPEEAKEREGKVLLEKLASFDYVVALDQHGKQVTSEEFSELLQARRNSGKRSVCFIIGGAYGLSEKVRQRANYILSLSKCTFPHQLTRLILVEQLYRSYTLMQGTRYHK
jgi:23S rRNA (pseudouridine1915-N3)-methyltransferase